MLVGTNKADCILGYGGNDTIQGGSGDDTLMGGPGDDRIESSNGKDVIHGGRGNDYIDASNAKDSEIYGDDGDDVILGGNGKDVLHGGAGNDRLEGGNGKDELYGDGCHDLLIGGNAPDTGFGGDGYDVCDTETTNGCERTQLGASCTQDANCGSGQRCAQSVHFCVPATAESCGSCVPRSVDDRTCDGIDDDCDGRIDDDFVASASSCGTGRCAATGTISCVNGQTVNSCHAGTPAASDLTCDGIDDDCDGKTDESYPVTTTTCGVGACAASGTQRCSQGSVTDSCHAGTPGAADTTCDGIDDDCNGRTDEDYASASTTCGVGVCAATGSRTCVGGAVQDTCTPGHAGTTDSSCNGADDDCDGRVDENYMSTVSTCGVGACAATGRIDCTAGRLVDTCHASQAAANDASCDGIDDDCSGTADEDYVPVPSFCGIGACTAMGTLVCVNGALVNHCAPHAPALSDSSCDGIDDDCDGSYDEDFVAQTTTCGIGACVASGTTACVAGHVSSNCAPRAPSANDASCNAVDDDCDGALDEDYLTQTTTCGVGACQAAGNTYCIEGQIEKDCTAGAPTSDDNCNGLDDDCDGVVDQGFQPSCVGTARRACVAGQVVTSDCDDHNACTGQETCSAGACQPGTAIALDDGDACTLDACNPETGAVTHTDKPVGASCSDGLACNGLERCGPLCTPLPSGVVAHWPAEGDAKDAFGTNDGTLNGGVEFTSGLAGQALRLNGSDAYLRAVVPIAGHDSVSFEFWTRTSAVQSGYILSIPRQSGGSNGLDVRAAGSALGVCAFPSGAGGCFTVPYNYADGVWHHIAVTLGDASVRLFVDGQLQGSIAATGTLITDANELNIGRFGSFGAYYRGDVDEVRLYGRALTSNEIAAQYTANGAACANRCKPGPSPFADDDCDGIDNDCDGRIDEAYVAEATRCGIGACRGTGQLTCVAGQLTDTCVSHSNGSVDVCNGVDDDCDGRVDENFVSTTVACGSSSCGATAPTACVNGHVVDLCFTAGADDNCNGWDDDCDGRVDEAFMVRCSGTVRQTCDSGVLVSTNCDDGIACNGTESCAAGACVAGAAPAINDDNVCTIDSCDSVLGLRHQAVPAGTSCADSNACNGVETCWVCRESANLLRNGGFEELDGPRSGQGVLPLDWFPLNSTPDTYSDDGSYGVSPEAFGNFPGVTAPEGKRWVAGATGSNFPEIIAQELDSPLRPGQSYRVSAKLHQALRGDLNNPGSYTVAVTDYYAPQRPDFDRITLGTLGPTVAFSTWTAQSFEFVAPAGADTKPVLVFIPTHAVQQETYPGLDEVSLVETCPKGDHAPTCRSSELPKLDDGNPCTTDSCDPSSGVSHAVTQGSLCNGTGICDAAGSCSNHLPVFTSQPIRWQWVGSGSSALYRYTVSATDPDPDSTISFSLIASAPGMTINGDVISWNAPELGTYPVRVRATDDRGGFTEQRYLLSVVLQHDVSTQHAPSITSRPETHAFQDARYRYDVKATDDHPESLRFSLGDRVPRGMTIDAVSGVISWTPSAAQLGTFEIQVKVTDAAGLSEIQTYDLIVANTDDAPMFVTSAPSSAMVAVEYRYQPIVRDLDGDVPAFSLSEAPSEMTINPSTGLLTWLPTENDVGPHPVSLVVVSGGFTITQSYTLTVHAPGELQPPVLNSTPPGTALVNQVYHYAIRATDPDAGDVLQYGGLVLPEGAHLDAATGDLVWVPRTNQLGVQTFRVAVTDGIFTVGQEWTVQVAAQNVPPQFVSSPPSTARVGQTYTYRCIAIDPDGDALEYELAAAPDGASIELKTGVLQWTPAEDQRGPFQLTVVVRDPHGAFSIQTFGVFVGDAAPGNLAPEFVSAPVLNAVSGALYSYVAEAVDPDGIDPLVYSLVEGPSGMTIDPSSGEVRWLASGYGSHQIILRATEVDGASGEQAFGVVVGADTQAPTVQLTASSVRFAPGELTTLHVSAHDQVSVAKLELAIDGAIWPVDADGNAIFQSQVSGPHRAVGTATDGGGRSASVELLLAVTQAGDDTAPIVSFGSSVADNVYTYIQDIVGTAQDENLLKYTLAIQREGTTGWTELKSGTQNVTNGAVGRLDTTQLRNGIYQLRLYAEDVNGLTNEIIRPIRVDGGAKVGVVQLSFTDMLVGMEGFPISVVRSYDSRRRSEKGDFGYGWSLDIHQGSIQHNRPVGSYFALFSGDTGASTFEFPCQRMNEQRPHITEIRLSDREWYLFRPQLANPEAYGGGCVADMYFELVDGSTAGAQLLIAGNTTVRADKSLRVGDATIDESIPMNLLDAYTLEDYNPSSFQLLLADGRLYDLTLDRGIVRFADRNDNWMFIEDDRLVHSDGRQIDIDRDSSGRIVRIRDPKGQTVTYAYDAAGDLTSVRDQLGLSTRFLYHAEPAHHLESIVRPDGITVAAMEYNTDGRLKESCDAEHHCTQFNYDLGARSQIITAPDSIQTKYEYDARGNVTKQTDGLGHAVSFQYDADDNLIEAQGPDGSVAKYRYDASRNLLRRELPHEADENEADFVYSYTYTARNDREKVTLPSGGVIAYDYDARGNQTAVRDGSGTAIEQRTYDADGRLQTRTGRFGTTTYSDFDVSGAPRTITDPFGVPATLTYDALGNLLSRSERGLTTTTQYDALSRPTNTDYGNGARVRYEYGDRGDKRWTAIEGPTFGRVERSFTARGLLGGWRESNGDTFARVYDAAARVSEEFDALGNRTTYAYDGAGRLDTITNAELNAVTKLERDDAGRITKTTDPLGHEAKMSYKSGGRLGSTTSARGKTILFEGTSGSMNITDALSRTTVTSLSAYGLPLGTTFADDTETASTFLGNTRVDESHLFPTNFEDELQRTRSYLYDEKSGLTAATDLAGESWGYAYAPTASSGLAYDIFSGTVRTAAQDSGAAAYLSSGAGAEYRDVPVTSGGTQSSRFTHQLSQVTSPMGKVTKFERAANGRINKITYPDNAKTAIEYDSGNRVRKIVLPEGTDVTLGYDVAGRENARRTSAGEFRFLTYGVGDRIETMTDNTGTTTYEYDQAGRFTGIVYPYGGWVRYTRDKLDRTTDVIVKVSAVAIATTTHYTYDPDGNLAEIVDPKGGVTGFQYDDAGRLERRILPNGIITSFTYDDRDRVLSIVHRTASNVVLASLSYVRSTSGEPTRITREDGTYVTLEYDAALHMRTKATTTLPIIALEASSIATIAMGTARRVS